MELKINFVAILVAVVVNFILGFIWYTPLFGKIWGREMGYDPDMKPEKSVMLKGMAFMIIGNFLFAGVLAHNILAWQFVPGIKEMGPLSNAISAAIFTWLGFYVPGELGATVWQKHSWKLFGINTGYNLASLLVVALILTHWT
jgi:multisubunit Na+/H+ antiporter MnhB subunit